LNQDGKDENASQWHYFVGLTTFHSCQQLRRSASWINQVERWFAELTRKQLQRGVHRSRAELEADIAAFIAAHNENPKPYRWVKSADEILASVKRFCQKTMSQPSDSCD